MKEVKEFEKKLIKLQKKYNKVVVSDSMDLVNKDLESLRVEHTFYTVMVESDIESKDYADQVTKGINVTINEGLTILKAFTFKMGKDDILTTFILSRKI